MRFFTGAVQKRFHDEKFFRFSNKAADRALAFIEWFIIALIADGIKINRLLFG